MKNSETSQARTGPVSTVNQQRADSQETDRQRPNVSNDKKDEMPEVEKRPPGAIIRVAARPGKARVQRKNLLG